MANNITLRQDFVNVLDEVYKVAATSAVLDTNTGLERLPSGKFLVPVMTLDGLADHTRTNGGAYIAGDTKLEYKEYEPTYDRNRKFTIDVRDDIETGDVAFGRLAGEFIRTQVAPEIDAVRYAAYAQAAGKKFYGTIGSAAALLESLEDAITYMDEKEVPQDERYLFITPTQLNAVKRLDTYKSQEILDMFAAIIKVPQTRFYEVVDLNDGTTSGQTSGGYKQGEDEGGAKRNLNYLIVHKGALVQGLRHEAPKHIPAAVNQTHDGDAFAYRVAGVEEVLFNKTDGVVASLTGDAPEE